MRYIYILISLLLASCASDIDHRKAVINFKVSENEFSGVKNILQRIAQSNEMLLTDSSYGFGTEKSPQTRLAIHLKGLNNLEIYTNCYSDWKKCSMEFLCYKDCPAWIEIVNVIESNILEKWDIIDSYKNNRT